MVGRHVRTGKAQDGKGADDKSRGQRPPGINLFVRDVRDEPAYRQRA